MMFNKKVATMMEFATLFMLRLCLLLGSGAPAKISGSYRTHTRGDKHDIKHGVMHGSEPLDQDGERAATQDSTDGLLDGVGDGNVVDVDDDDPIVIKSPLRPESRQT